MSAQSAPANSQASPLAAEPDPSSGPTGLRSWLLAMTVSIATFMELLDGTIANVALPYFSGALGVPVDVGSWALTSYLVGTGAAIPVADKLSRMIGRRRYYLMCVAIFTVTSALCGLATSLEQLVFFRIIQGLAGGGMRPTEMAILLDAFPVEKRGTAMSIYMTSILLAPGLGPFLGGYFTEMYSWRWIFYINLPFGILSMVLVYFLIFDPPHLVEDCRKNPTTLANFDWLGLVLFGVSLSCLQVILDRGQIEDWFGSTLIVNLTIVMACTLIGGVAWELWTPTPLLELRLLRDRTFAAGCLLGLFGTLYYNYGSYSLSLFLQLIMDYSPMITGEVVGLPALVNVLIIPIMGRLIDRGFDPRVLIIGCGLVGIVVQRELSSLNLQFEPSHVVFIRAAQILGSAGIVVPVTSVAFSFLPKPKMGQASMLYNIGRNIGSSVSIALASTLLTRQSQAQQNYLAEHFSPTNLQFQRYLDHWRQTMIDAGTDPHTADTKGMAIAYEMLKYQSQYAAFMDVFWILGMTTAVFLPLAFLIKRRPRKP